MRPWALVVTLSGVLASCGGVDVDVQTIPDEPDAPLSAPTTAPAPTPAEVERLRETTRRQFEAARERRVHVGGGMHFGASCPHCVDPMRGQVPGDALVDGPMEVWY